MAFYAIVLFTEEEDAPGVVSSCWLSPDNSWCWFPNTKSELVKNRLTREHSVPKTDWMKCPIRILKSYEQYEDAVHRLSEAENTSCLESDFETLSFSMPPKKHKRKTQDTSDEDDSLSLYSFPPPPKKLTKASEMKTPGMEGANSLHSTPKGVISKEKNIQDELQTIKQTQGEIMCMLKELMACVQKTEAKISSMAAVPNFNLNASNDEIYRCLPLSSEEEMQSFEERLKTNNFFREQFLSIMLSGYGRDCKAFVCSCMRKVLGDKVAAAYTLTGRNRTGTVKLCFESTQIFLLIKEATMKSYGPGTKEVSIRDAASDWLLQAKFRLSRRQKKDTAVEPEPL